MLIILPLLAFIFLFLENFTAHHDQQFVDWREALLRTAILWGTCLAIISESLSFLKLLTPAGVAVCWSLVGAVTLITGWRIGWLEMGWHRLAESYRSFDWKMFIALLGFGAILALLLLTASIAAPNNKDSLQYHLTRVVHWAQNRSLNHYPTVFGPQLWNPVWAEEALLHLRLLWGNDRLANLVQWLSMLGSLFGVSLIAGQLGAGRWGQLGAAAFTISLPMGILQATSTQNDYVVAFWLVCLAYFTMRAARQPLDQLETLYMALALGLGLLTKSTAYPFAAPFVIWYFLARFIRQSRIEMARSALMLGGIVLILNGPYWLRNMGTFGGPFGQSEWVEAHTGNLNRGAWIIALARNTLQNFPTPDEQLNLKMVKPLETLQEKLGLGEDDFHLIWGWNYEDTAGNPLHVGIGLLTLLVLLIFYRHKVDHQLLVFTGVILATYGMLALVVTTDLYGIRYQLPFWVCFSPVFGAVLTLASEKRLAGLAIAGLLLVALPWVFFNRTRPLISMRQAEEPLTIPCYLGCTTIGSILLEDPLTITMASQLEYRDSYRALAQAIEDSGCKSIGLDIDSHDAEYPYWYILNAPQSGVRIETIETYPYLEKYVDRSFKPCAIFCTICYTAEEQMSGLPYINTFGDVRLYQQLNYQPEVRK